MSFNRLFICLLSAAFIAGCASERSLSQNNNPPGSVCAATGDGNSDFKNAVIKGRCDTSDNPRLGDATAPELKNQTRRIAYGKQDSTSTEQPAVAVANTDLWQRLRDGFALNHDIDQPRLEQQLAWHAAHPRYIQQAMERGSRYFHYIVSETERRGLPTELALLPMVESAFDPFAYSRSRAAGLWQFIPSTGKYFGLTQSWWHDDRRDLIAATDAALTYLERLSKRFGGDYTLALAAYNSGGGTVSKAMRRNRNAGQPTDFWSLKLPAETRKYVPKLLALAKIIADPQAFGIKLPTLANEPYFAVVETGSQLDLAKAAELAAIDIDELNLLNPSFKRWATNPNGPHRLLVPAARAQEFRRALTSFPVNQRVSWRNYKVRPGDNLSTIAQRFGTTTSVIRQLNKLRSDVIGIGQRLMIPAPTGDGGRYASNSRRTQTGPSPGPAGISAGNSAGDKVSYRIRSGDTLWDIAREHRVKVHELVAWNSLNSARYLQPGQSLVLYVDAQNSL